MTALLVLAGVLLLIGGSMSIAAINRGPTNLDRALGADVLVVIVISAMALYIAWTRDEGSLPILMVAAPSGFVGSVSVARFMARRRGGRV